MRKTIGVMLVVGMGIVGVAGNATAESRGKKSSDEIHGTVKTQYKCELGKRITVFTKADQRDTIMLRWNNKNHTLRREATSTGANRFENKDAGLVWINIPAKGILLDSKRGRQLANDCKA